MSRQLADHLHAYGLRLSKMAPEELAAEDARHNALGYAASRAAIEGRADGDFGAPPSPEVSQQRSDDASLGAVSDVSLVAAHDTSPEYCCDGRVAC